MSFQISIIFGVLILLACVFFLIPWFRMRKIQTANHHNALIEESVRLFNEQILDLNNQKDTNRISDAEFQSVKLEMEQNLLHTCRTLKEKPVISAMKNYQYSFIGIFIVFSITAWMLYQHLGASDDIRILQLQQNKMMMDREDMMNNKLPDISKTTVLIDAIEERLKEQPDNIYYWFFLARLSTEKGDFARSVTAYREVLNKDQSSGMITAELAQTLFYQNKHQMTDEIVQLAEKAISLEPNNTTALSLLGMHNFTTKHYLEAIKYWQKAMTIAGANSEFGIGIAMGIEKAKTAYLAEGGSSETIQKLSASKTITISVAVAPGVNAKPDQLVFVYARTWQGSKMPLAITRIPFSHLPTQVTLTEEMAMSPSATLATAEQVEVVARISQDGTAMSKPGDWQESQGPVDMNRLPEKINLVISKQLEN